MILKNYPIFKTPYSPPPLTHTIKSEMAVKVELRLCQQAPVKLHAVGAVSLLYSEWAGPWLAPLLSSLSSATLPFCTC